MWGRGHDLVCTPYTLFFLHTGEQMLILGTGCLSLTLEGLTVEAWGKQTLEGRTGVVWGRETHEGRYRGSLPPKLPHLALKGLTQMSPITTPR